MQVNGKQLTEKETLNLYKKQLKELKKELKTETIHNEIVFVNRTIRRIETSIKWQELREKQSKVRTQFEFDKIQKQLDKMDSNFSKEFNTSIEDYLRVKRLARK